MIARLVINALALVAAWLLVPGIRVTDTDPGQQALTIVVVAAVFGLVNALVKPVAKALSLPLVFMTLGLFLLVINAAMLLLSSWLAGKLGAGFEVAGWVPAILGSVVISVVSALASAMRPKKGDK